MRHRYFNWKLAVVLVIGLAVLAATAFGLRHWQRGRRAHQGLTLGNKAYSEGNWQEAASQLGRFLSIISDDVPVLLKYADAEINIRPVKSGNIQQAIAAYRNVLRLSPGHIEAATRLTELYLVVGAPGDAEQVATRALLSAQSPRLRRMLAMALAGQRKFTAAAAELESVIKDNPGEIQAYEALARLIEQRPEDFNVSPQFWFDEAVKNNPSSAQACIIRGAYYLRLGQKSQALADFDQAQTKNFDDPNVRILFAEQLINAEQLQKAQQQLEIAENDSPSSQALWRVWASLATKSGSEQLMLNVVDRGLKQLSRQPLDFMPVAAELYIRCGRLEQADDCISKLRLNDANPPATAFLEGLLAEAKGQGYETVKCWQKAIDLGAEAGTLRLAMAKAFLRLGDTQSAIKQLRSLVYEQPKNVKTRVELARLLGEAGKWAESAENARIAVGLAPADADAAFVYAFARSRLVDSGDPDYKMRQALIQLESDLQRLDDAMGDSIEVKLLKLQLAVNVSDYNKAQTCLEQMKNSYPSDMRVTMAQADLLVAQGKINEAVTVLTQALEKSPDSVALVRALMGVSATQNLTQQCEDAANRAMTQSKLPSDKKQIGLMLARFYAGLNEQEKRCDLLGRLCEQFPDDVSVLRSMLTCPLVLKDLPRAQGIVDKIKTIEGQTGWQWRFEQARVWFAQDNFKNLYPQLVALLKDNLLNDPDDQASRMLLAAAYEKANDVRLAVATYDEALSRSPKDIRVIVAAAAALYKAGEYDRADQIIRRSDDIKTDNPQLKQLRLQSFIRRGEFDSAGAVLEDIFTADSNNPSLGLSLALLKMRQGQLDEAAAMLNDLIAGDPNFLHAIAAKVELDVRKGRSAEAIKMCDDFVERTNQARAMILRGRAFAMLGQIDLAGADFERAVLVEPNNVEARLTRSDFYRSVGRDVEAALDLQRASALEPNNVRIQKRAILFYLADADLTKRRQGLSLLDSALQAHPDDFDLQLYKARGLVAQDTAVALAEAKSILEVITRRSPMESEAWKLLSDIAAREGQSARAIDLVLEGLAHQPRDKSLLLLRARLEGARSPQIAVSTLNALHDMDPNDVQTSFYLADMLIAAGRFEQAIDLLKTQLDLHNAPADQRILKLALATALYKSQKQDDASQIFDSLQQSAPDDPAPLLTQSRLLTDDRLFSRLEQKINLWLQSHPDDVNTPLFLARQLASNKENEPRKIAEDLLRRILREQPDSQGANFSLAVLLQNSARPEKAAEVYKHILKLDPDNIVAINNLAWILCEDQNQYQQALDFAERGLKKQHDYVDLKYVDLLDTRGVALYRLGQFQRAAEDLNQCVNLYPANTPSLAASYFHLARVQAKLGQNDQAVENLKKALELTGKTGGLSNGDSAEAQKLLENLSKGGG